MTYFIYDERFSDNKILGVQILAPHMEGKRKA